MAANWISVVPDMGAALFSSWLEGGHVSFDYAQGGTGTVPESDLASQTALVNKKQDLSIIWYERTDEGIRIAVQTTAHVDAYNLNQIGIFASIDGGDSVMVAILQDNKGLDVPSVAESPDFIYKKFLLIKVSNIGTFTVNIDTTAVVSQSTLAAAISGKQDIIAADGILKGDGAGVITRATVGVDYGYPTITGSGEPGSATIGGVGQHYLDTDAGEVYVCTGLSGSDYVWKKIGISGSTGIAVSDTQPSGMQPGDLWFKITA